MQCGCAVPIQQAIERGRQGQVKVLGKDVVDDDVVKARSGWAPASRLSRLAHGLELGRHLALLQLCAHLRNLGVLRVHLGHEYQVDALWQRLGLTPAGDDGDRIASLRRTSERGPGSRLRPRRPPAGRCSAEWRFEGSFIGPDSFTSSARRLSPAGGRASQRCPPAR